MSANQKLAPSSEEIIKQHQLSEKQAPLIKVTSSGQSLITVLNLDALALLVKIVNFVGIIFLLIDRSFVKIKVFPVIRF